MKRQVPVQTSRKTAAAPTVHASRITDRVNRGADPDILSVILALQHVDVPVVHACEGHPGDRKRSSTPWVDIKTNSPKSYRIVERTVLRLLDAFYSKHRPPVSHTRLCLRPTLRLESLGADVANDAEAQTNERLARRNIYLGELQAFGTFLLSLPQATK